MAGHGKNSILTHFYVLFLVIASAAFMVTIYHCIVIIWRKRQHRANSEQQATVLRHTDIRSSIERSICQLIPTHKHEKCKGSHDAVCPVCLSEFEDGEELRTLPECLHSFHVACIDMWLHSHPNCPVCRTNATPSPSPQVRFDFRMSQDLGIQRMAV